MSAPGELYFMILYPEAPLPLLYNYSFRYKTFSGEQDDGKFLHVAPKQHPTLLLNYCFRGKHFP